MSKKSSNRSVFENIRYLVRNTWKYDKRIFLIFAIYTIAAGVLPFVDILTPKFLLDELTTLKRPHKVFFILIMFFIGSSILNYLVSYLQSVSSARIMGVRFEFMKILQRKTMTMDFKYTESPEVLNNVETAWRAADSNSVGIEGMIEKVFFIMGGFISFFGYIAIVTTLSPFILMYLVINVTIVYLMTIKVKKYEHKQKDNISECNRKGRYIYEIMYNFSYGKDIRIYDLSKWLVDKFIGYREDKLNIQKGIFYKYLKVSAIDVLLLMLREGVVYGYLIYRVIYTSMSIGDFSMYFVTIGGFSAWMKGILSSIANIRLQNLYINDFRDFIEFAEDEDGMNTSPVQKSDKYEIEFRNVWFKYPNSERYILKNLSLKIEAGQRLAIVGANGEGKTTFVKLLTRLYEPTEGEILLNGINISTINKEDYFKLFSVVFQDINLFAFSVAENIALTTDEKIDRQKVMDSIKMANIDDKIETLENGIDTSVLKVIDMKGIELSGGEKQKLILARALYKNGPIVILDEPTAALDPLAEHHIYQSFNEIIGDKIGIYISHRLASTRFCHVIALFHDGEIKEYGSHEELLELNGKYTEMFNVQASYYKEIEEVMMSG